MARRRAELDALPKGNAGEAAVQSGYVELFRWGSVLVAMPSILWSASVFYRGALGAIRTFTDSHPEK